MAFLSSQNVFNGIPCKSWPLYRGKMAGKLVKLRELVHRQQIRVAQSREINRTKVLSSTQRTHSPSNFINIHRSCSPTEDRYEA